MVPTHLPDPIRAIRLIGGRGDVKGFIILTAMWGKGTTTFVSSSCGRHNGVVAVSRVISLKLICYSPNMSYQYRNDSVNQRRYQKATETSNISL